MADNHVIYKTGAKEIALGERLLDHVHGEAVRVLDRELVPRPRVALPGRRARVRDDERSSRFLAGQIACFEELAVFLAPTINSYKRYAAGSWAPTTLAWGRDNRTCGFRVVGHGRSKRVETRIPGGDVNPYLAFAAIIAAGCTGSRRSSSRRRRLEGNAYESDAERFPSRCERRSRARGGTVAREAFGDQVVDHYLNYARTEQALFDKHVTDWERMRHFERG